jgi:hypothetical protein
VQLEEGLLTDYQPERTVDVGLNRVDSDEQGLIQPGSPVTFNVDVFSQSGGSVSLTYTLKDYWGTTVETRTSSVGTTAGQGTRSTVQFTPVQPGIYKLVTQYQAGTVSGYAEERSFGVLPTNFTSPTQITTATGTGADTWVNWDSRYPGYNADVNYGNNSDLSLWDYSDGGVTIYRKAYLRFDLTGAPETITSAQLVLTPSAANTFFFYNLYAVKESYDTWTESTITWNNAPANQAGLGIDPNRVGFYGAYSFYGNAGVPIALDLPQSLIDFLNQDTDNKITLILVPYNSQTTGTSAQYYAKEGTADVTQKPTLVFNAKNPTSYFGGHCAIDQSYGLSTMAKLGMKWIRLHDQAYSFVNDWNDVETAPGTFSWTAGDTAVNTMRAQNLNILGRLGGSLADVPSWVAIDPATKLPNLAAWNTYVYNIVSHYAGRIDYWEVWNEPYWDFGSVPQSYVDLLWSTYQQVKLANPNAKVVGVCGHLGDLGRSAPDNWESEWFRTALQLAGNCPQYPMDIVSHHNYLYYPYPELFPSPMVSLQSRLATLKTWLQTYSPNKSILMWDTEHTVRPGLFFTDRLFGSDNWWVRFDPWNYDYKDGCNWLVRQYITSLACGQQKLFYFTPQYHRVRPLV